MPDQIFRAIPAWGEEPKYNPHIAKAMPYLNEPYPSAQRLHPIDPYVSCDSNASASAMRVLAGHIRSYSLPDNFGIDRYHLIK
jgi:hypothetical protein